jgi:hypothetical protein
MFGLMENMPCISGGNRQINTRERGTTPPESGRCAAIVLHIPIR